MHLMTASKRYAKTSGTEAEVEALQKEIIAG